jgi:hypothetical protein
MMWPTVQSHDRRYVSGGSDAESHRIWPTFWPTFQTNLSADLLFMGPRPRIEVAQPRPGALRARLSDLCGRSHELDPALARSPC